MGERFSKRRDEDGLTERERRFCEEFVVDSNAMRAAREVGYKDADRSSANCMNRPAVKRKITQLFEEKQKRTEITADRVLTEIGRIAFADITHIFDEQGNIKPHAEWPEEFSAAIKSMKFSDGQLTDIQLHDKPSALEKVMKYLGMLTTKLQVEGTVEHRWQAMPDTLKQRLLEVTGVPVLEGEYSEVKDDGGPDEG